MKNIVLIGMPGAGKSTIGVLLAKSTLMDFTDTDLLIQKKYSSALCDIINEKGIDEFLKIENDVICEAEFHNCVVATGGSAVLRETSMAHLRENGVCVYLNLPYSVIARRVNNRNTRGIAAENHETLKDIYDFRTPYYEKYADFTVDCRGKSAEKNVAEVLRVLIGIE